MPVTRPQERVALITGASRGLGRACAEELARCGFRVAVTARTLRQSDQRSLSGNLEDVARSICDQGGEALPIKLDLDDRPSVVAGVATVLDQWGRIDVLVNNAFYQTRESQWSLVDMSMEHLDKQIRVNLLAPMFLAKLVLPQMLERHDGVVANMVSGAGVHELNLPPGPRSWGFGYGTSKTGMIEIAAMLASQFRRPGHPRLQCATRNRADRAAARRPRGGDIGRRGLHTARAHGPDHRLAGHRTRGGGAQRGADLRSRVRARQGNRVRPVGSAERGAHDEEGAR